MRKKWFVCALCMLSVGFVSCSDDDGEEAGGNGGFSGGSGTPAMEAPAVSGAGIQFPVTSVNDGYGWVYYSYANGRMTGGWLDNEDYSFWFTSNPLTIQTNDSEVYRNIKVNDSGFITYCEYASTPEGDCAEYVSVSCAYDGEGHLTLEKGKYWDDEGGNSEFTGTYTWSNGNLVKYDENVVETEDGEVYTMGTVIELEYDEGRYPNPGIFFDKDGVDAGPFLETQFYYAGMLGRCCKNIPVRATKTWYEDGESYGSNKIEITGVEYNENGSVKNVSTQEYGYSHTYQYGYEPVTPQGKSVKSMPATSKRKASGLLRRLHERRMR